MSIKTGTREYVSARIDGKPLITEDEAGRYLHVIDVTEGVKHLPCPCGTDHEVGAK